MRWAACFFVVRAEYQGASSMRPGTTPPPALWGADRTNCPDKIRFAKSGRAGIIAIIAQHSAPEK